MSPTYIGVVFYIVILFTAIFGNALSIAAVCRNQKLRMAVYILLANVSLSDLLFALFSIIDAAYFLMDKWVFSEAFCRMQGAFMEVFYTVSILSLTAVAIERYLSICHLSKGKRTVASCLKWIGLIWFVSILICSPLFYGYSTSHVVRDSVRDTDVVDESVNMTEITMMTASTLICTNNYWSPGSGIAFYTIHTTLIYVLPLFVMFVTHTKITLELRKRRKQLNVCQKLNMVQSQLAIAPEKRLKDSNRFSRAIFDLQTMKLVKQRARNIKIIKLLVVLTTLFFILWTPFIVTRILRFTTVPVPQTLWKLVQLLILASTAVNFFIYASMSAVLRKTFLSFLPCSKWWTISKLMGSGSKDQLQDNEPSDLVLSL